MVLAVGYTGIARRIGRPLESINNQKRVVEADYRNKFSNVRTHANEIMSYNAAPVELRKVTRAFRELLTTWKQQVIYNTGLTFFNESNAGLNRLVSPAVGGVAYLMQSIGTVGGIMQFSLLFDKILDSMMWWANITNVLAEVKPLKNRLVEFAQKIELAQNLREFYASEGKTADIESVESIDGTIRVHKLAIYNSGNKPLLDIVKLKAKPGEFIGLEGPSGKGKSLFLKALWGEWKLGKGRISLPTQGYAMFLSQAPYMYNGTLRENLAYPMMDAGLYEDKDMERALASAELANLIPHLDDLGKEGMTWNEMSPGEQQRVALARAFLQQPDYLFLDEATASIDQTLQDKIYERIVALMKGKTAISISHRPELSRFHTRTWIVKDEKIIDAADIPEVKDSKVVVLAHYRHRAHVQAPRLA